mgnify:CR=1 FL=1
MSFHEGDKVRARARDKYLYVRPYHVGEPVGGLGVEVDRGAVLEVIEGTVHGWRGDEFLPILETQVRTPSGFIGWVYDEQVELA